MCALGLRLTEAKSNVIAVFMLQYAKIDLRIRIVRFKLERSCGEVGAGV
jgi:hypothetical protein